MYHPGLILTLILLADARCKMEDGRWSTPAFISSLADCWIFFFWYGSDTRKAQVFASSPKSLDLLSKDFRYLKIIDTIDSKKLAVDRTEAAIGRNPTAHNHDVICTST